MRCNLCKFDPRAGWVGHTSRCCPLREVECHRTVPLDIPLHVSGHFLAPHFVHRAQCDACGFCGHTRMTLKLVSTRWRVSSTGLVVLVHNAPALTQTDFACCLMSEADVRLRLSTVYSGGR